MGSGHQTSLWINSAGKVDDISCLLSGVLGIFALIQYLLVEQTIPTWDKDTNSCTLFKAECKVLELGWPNQLCHNLNWFWVVELQTLMLRWGMWVENAVKEFKEATEGID